LRIINTLYCSFRARESNGFGTDPSGAPRSSVKSGASMASANKSFRYMRRQPTIVQYDPEMLLHSAESNNNGGGGGVPGLPGVGRDVAGGGVGGGSGGGGGGGGGEVRFGGDLVVTGSGKLRRRARPSNRIHPKDAIEAEDGPGKKMTLKKPLEVRDCINHI